MLSKVDYRVVHLKAWFWMPKILNLKKNQFLDVDIFQYHCALFNLVPFVKNVTNPFFTVTYLCCYLLLQCCLKKFTRSIPEFSGLFYQFLPSSTRTSTNTIQISTFLLSITNSLPLGLTTLAFFIDKSNEIEQRQDWKRK